ncbi:MULTISPECIES: TerC family protein [Clostridium]|uniref:TerC family protein n=1 Tax=Clostridium cibarium TaxID=2762247 RepID=A0ABR8PVJ5_9CLOT|nr:MULTISPECIES: TerC family protein [Clostridium]MBD7912208.1 TerC family protein [Clostridium cibarium]
MDFLNGLVNNYSQFFSLDVLLSTLSNPSNLMMIFSLAILEGLLSSDNAIVLAIMVRHLPKKQQKKALFYGIWGAYIFRFIAIGVGTYLIKIWWVKLLAAFYLLKMTYAHFVKREDNEEVDESKVINKGFWATVASVEMMDIAFSIDSVSAAFGVSDEVWVLYLGAVFGILAMRGVAKIFISLIEKIPELEGSAYVLIGFIGVRMLLGIINIEISNVIFFTVLIFILGGTVVLHYMKPKVTNTDSENAVDSEK